MCTFLVQVTVEANHPIAERQKCWHTRDSRAGTSSPMQIFVKTLTGKTITLDPWWISKFQATGCSLRHVSGARSCNVMSCFVASHLAALCLWQDFRITWWRMAFFRKLMPKWPRWIVGFNFLWPSILRRKPHIPWCLTCVCFFFRKSHHIKTLYGNHWLGVFKWSARTCRWWACVGSICLPLRCGVHCNAGNCL